MTIGMAGIFSFVTDEDKLFSYQSPYLKIRLRRDRPEFTFFSTDSLGDKGFSNNLLLLSEQPSGQQYESRMTSKSIAYFPLAGKDNTPKWECKADHKTLTIRTRWEKDEDASPFAVAFSQRANHCTVLGEMISERQMKFPCVLHFPGMGTFRLYCSIPGTTLYYDAKLTDKPYVKIALPSADLNHRDITYKFESVAIFPKIGNGLERDHRYDGYKKNFINIFQFSPGFKVLANNSTSDACAFTLFLYAEMARASPMLVEGLTAMDLIRNTLDEYLNGFLGYGMVGKPNWTSKYDSTDSYPSLIISACYYMLDTKDKGWARKNYYAVRNWAERMIGMDTNGDGIIEYGYSGNSGSWANIGTRGSAEFRRPANWMDCIGFGHDDAYSNALAYRSCLLLAKVAEILDKQSDRDYFEAFAKKLKSNYFTRFFNPGTGVLGGWRSSDGQLHDYYFLFVNGIAISYDLIEVEKAQEIMKVLLDKMKEVGYTDFRLGLPGNLIPIPNEDYVDNDPRVGFGKFQVYENGGATGCFAYYTIHALYKLNMVKEADEIFMAMLESYKEGGFRGHCPGGTMSKDWKDWKGGCWGYEGFLVDNYLPLLAMEDYTAASRNS